MPLRSRQQGRRRHTAPAQRNSPPTAKANKPANQRVSTTSPNSFDTLHSRRDDLLQLYVNYPLRHYRRLSAELSELISPDGAVCLHPCNAGARVRFARIVQRQLARFGIPSSAPLCWVTLAPGQFAFPIAEAGKFNPKRFIATIRQALGDIPFLAIIEAGHYRASPHMPSPLVLGPDLKLRRSDMVSWHVHLITWGYSDREVRAKLKAFRNRNADMLGRDCVHVVGIDPNEAAFKLLYASKGQVKSYRHILRKGIDVDPETGEMRQKVRQSKDWMRTGDHVKMIEVFGRTRIDQLVFGNGLGTDLANVIRYEAMAPFCEWAAREIDKDEGRREEFPFIAPYRKLGQQLQRKFGADFLGDGPIRAGGLLGHNRRRAVARNRC